jgi:DNA-binding CsgD family transcriptional regulator/tetratricopeptide (TPR) repeat protein
VECLAYHPAVDDSVRREFVGRETELERLRASLGKARDGRTTTVLIGGEAGIGKSRLIEHFSTEAANSGAFVAIGGCPPTAEAELPFAPIVDALRSIARRLSADELADAIGSAGAALAGLVPGATPGDGNPLAGGRTAVFEAALGLVERIAEARGCLVLVLEDLHWADRSTRELLAYLAHNLRDSNVLIVASYRTDDLPLGHPLRLLLAELDRSERVVRLDLPRFTFADVRAQVIASLGTEPSAGLVERIATRSDGNPFFVEELAGMLRLDRTDDVPETLRELLRSRLASLPPAVDQVLRICAAVGPRIDNRLLAALVPMSPDELSLILRDAVSRNLLATIRDAEGEAFGFRRSLLREVIDEDLLPTERRRYHHAIANVLEAHNDYVDGPPAVVSGVIAQHWLQADNPGHARKALIRAGRAAMDAYAFPEAARAFEGALRIWESASEAEEVATDRDDRRIGFRSERMAGDRMAGTRGQQADRGQVIRQAAQALSLSGEPGRAASMLRELIDASGPSGVAGRGEDLLHLGRYLADDGDLDGALAAYEEASAIASVDADVNARLGVARANVLLSLGRHEDAHAAAAHALVAATALSSESIARSARQSLGVALAMAGDVDAGLAELAEARRVPTRSRRTSVIRPRPSRIGELVRGMAGHAAILERAGRPTEFARAAREGADLARQFGVEATLGGDLAVADARMRFQLGDWDEADRLTRELLETGSSRPGTVRLHVIRSLLKTHRGSFDDAAAHLDAAHQALPQSRDPGLIAELAAAETELAIWRTQLTEAREIVGTGIDQLHRADDQLQIITLAWLGVRAEADRAESARARRATGDVADAAGVAAALRAEAGALATRHTDRATGAPRELLLMPLLVEAEWTRLQRPSDADAWANTAIRAEQLRDPWLTAYARWREAEAALTGGEGRARAEAAARAAHATATDLGARPLRSELEVLARRGRLGLEVNQAREPEDARTSVRDTLGLTEREIEVLGLVALGYTNRRIAEELFITEKTAGHHVSNVLGKLGAATRMEAAAIAHRLDLFAEVAQG